MRQVGATRSVVHSTYINIGCKAVGKLMDNFSINVKFTLKEPKVFKVGDYIDLRTSMAEGDEMAYSFPEFIKYKYVLKSLYYPTFNTTTGGYDYDITFVAFWQAWGNRIYKFTPSIFGQEAKWSFMGTLEEHLRVFLKNLVAYAKDGNHLFKDFLDENIGQRDGYDDMRVEDVFSIDTDYIYGESNIEGRHVFISYEGKSMSEVFNELCSEDKFDCDWWYSDGKFHFGKCEDAVGFTDLSNTPLASSEAMNDYANRLICFGGEQNLTARYRKDLVFNANKIVDELPEMENAFVDYKKGDYALMFRDEKKKDLTTDIIKKSNINSHTNSKTIQIGGGYHYISFNERNFNSQVPEKAKFPFGLPYFPDGMYICENLYDYNDARYIFTSRDVHLGRIGKESITVVGKDLIFNPRCWYTNNDNFVNDEVDVPNQYQNISKEIPLSTMFVKFEVLDGESVLYTKYLCYYVYLTKVGASYVRKPTYFETEERPSQNGHALVLERGEEFKFEQTTLPISNIDADCTLRMSFGCVIYNMQYDNAKYFMKCELSGSAYVERKGGAESGVCTLDFNGVQYKDALVFNPTQSEKYEAYYSYFGLKRSACDKLLTDNNISYTESNLVEKVKALLFNKDYRLADIVFGKVKVNYFTQYEQGDNITNTIINRNLMLPETFYLKYNEILENGEVVEYGDIEYSMTKKSGFVEVRNKNYIEAFSNINSSEIIETLLVDNEIFPMMFQEKVHQVALYNWYDDNESPHEVSQRHYQYAFNTTFNFSEDCIIEGQTLKVRFTSGALNGMEFEVKYHRFAVGYECVDGTILSVQHGDKEDGNAFVIIPNEDYGLEFPNDTCKPKVDDEFILIGFDPTAMPEDNNMVTDAEERLLEKMVSRANQIRNNSATYTAALNADTKTNVSNYYLGRRIKVKDIATNLVRMSRVIGYDINLDFSYDHPTFTIGQSAQYSRLRTMQRQTSLKSDGKLK